MHLKADVKLNDTFSVKIDTPEMLIHQHYLEFTASELLEAMFMLKRKQGDDMVNEISKILKNK